MRVARLAARAIGWVFVAAIGYHAVYGVIEARRAASSGNWSHATELMVISILAAALVVAAVFSAAQSARARR